MKGKTEPEKNCWLRPFTSESSRSKKSIQFQNCSSFKGDFLELEIFGYTKKAFSKSRKDKKALLEKLNGGTLAINEISSSSKKFQARLLAFLKTGLFCPLGSSKKKKSNVRIIAIANKNLKMLAQNGKFNRALYNEISGITVRTPALRQRKMDIPLLAQHFLKTNGPLKQRSFSLKAMKILYNYPWPGNVQELETEIDKLLSLNPKSQDLFTEKDLSPHIRHSTASHLMQWMQPGKYNLKKALQSLEKQILLECLQKNNWNKTKVAKALGASRTSIIFKTKEYGIKEGA